MDKTKSTGILINKIKLMDKIDCEIEVAKSVEKSSICYPYFNGKREALQDLKQWIEDLE